MSGTNEYASAPWRAGAAVTPSAFESLRRTMLLEHCKWDAQVGDVATLAAFPLLIRPAAWQTLAALAEKLSAELLSAEAELRTRPELHRALAVPPPLRRLLRRSPPTPSAGRMLRFDFHWTHTGWQVSEVNSDVPGGYAESSIFPALMAEQISGTRPLGDPANAWVDAIAAGAGPCRRVALLAATGFLEDQQVVAFLSQRFRLKGVVACLATPSELKWIDGRAQLNDQPIGAIVRFYQAEWLTQRSARPLFVGGRTPVANPVGSVLTESKRLPLIWNALAAPMPTWRALLPETREIRNAPWRHDDGWLLKSAYCNTGDTVAVRSLLTARQWAAVKRAVWLRPGDWIAQRRFRTLPLDSPVGPIYPCLGVYTLDGGVVGVYGRFSSTPLIDYAAIDVAVLAEADDDCA